MTLKYFEDVISFINNKFTLRWYFLKQAAVATFIKCYNSQVLTGNQGERLNVRSNDSNFQLEFGRSTSEVTFQFPCSWWKKYTFHHLSIYHSLLLTTHMSNLLPSLRNRRLPLTHHISLSIRDINTMMQQVVDTIRDSSGNRSKHWRGRKCVCACLFSCLLLAFQQRTEKIREKNYFAGAFSSKQIEVQDPVLLSVPK